MSTEFEKKVMAVLTEIKHEMRQVQLAVKRNKSKSEWMSAQELIAYLPFKIAKPTVYRWVKDGKIPHVKKGKEIVFLLEDVDKWLITKEENKK